MIALLLALSVAVASPSFVGEPGAWFEPSGDPRADPYPGELLYPPAFQFRAKLPGPPLNAATHAEWGDPVIYKDGLLVGSAKGRALYLLSRRDGAVKRVYPASNSVEAEPTVHDGHVYFSDTGGNTFCYTLEGQLVWRHDGTAPILAAPMVKDRLVVVTNVDDLAVALQVGTGELEWQYRARKDLTREAELALYAAPAAVEIGDGTVVLGFSTGSLVAVDLQTGEEQWARDIGEGRYPDLVATPVEQGTDLFTGGFYKPLVALDKESHAVRWRVDVGGAFRPALSEDGTILYHPGTDGKLRAVAVLTGAELWSWDSGNLGSITTPRITPAGLLVASSEGSIYLIDPATGTETWRWHEDYLLRGVSSMPVVEGRQLMFISNAGYLYSMLSVGPGAEPDPLWP